MESNFEAFNATNGFNMLVDMQRKIDAHERPKKIRKTSSKRKMQVAYILGTHEYDYEKFIILHTDKTGKDLIGTSMTHEKLWDNPFLFNCKNDLEEIYYSGRLNLHSGVFKWHRRPKNKKVKLSYDQASGYSIPQEVKP